jgi:circadian clock protein KaiC
MTTELARTGIEGLDAILRGGLPRGRVHLIQGAPGTGKTTLGLQFALAGVAAGESALYLSMAETEEELRRVAAGHGWSLDGVGVRFRSAEELEREPQTVLHAAEVELPQAMAALFEILDRERPNRLVLDSLTELRLLARETRWFRREVLRLRQKLEEIGCTVLLLDMATKSRIVETLPTSVIQLEQTSRPFGPDFRRLRVLKVRAHEFETGYHDMRIRRGGLVLYPRLPLGDRSARVPTGTMSTGLPALDTLLGGGLDRGRACLLLGPTGTGKSSLAMQCLLAAAERGERSVLYVFDEAEQTVRQRAAGLGQPLEHHLAAGTVELRPLGVGDVTAGRFSHAVARDVDERDVRLVVIDSLNAYRQSTQDDDVLTVHLRELLAFLGHRGVTTLMLASEHGVMVEPYLPPGFDFNYLADTMVLFGMYAEGDSPRKALSVYKRRAGGHDPGVYEYRMSDGGLEIGPALPESRDVFP